MNPVLHKDILEYRRDKRLLALIILMLALLFASSVDGWNRAVGDKVDRDNAVAVDKSIWVEQGDNNPHGAAHFARYAFRGVPSLAAFDPGVFDYAGAAFWMEAHTRNPAALRRAENAPVQAPFSSLSPAWILQVIGSLVLATALFAALAGERERGTLHTLAAAGLGASEFVAGKVSIAIGLTLSLTLSAILVALLPAFALDVPLNVTPVRVVLIMLMYIAGMLAFAFVVLWVSARAASEGDAFGKAAMIWLFMALLSPVLGAQLGATIYPDIDEQRLNDAIQQRAQSPFWVGDAREDAVQAMERSVVKEFGVSSFDDLGFDREALVLQAHEEFANRIYDDMYGDLYARQLGQDKMIGWFSVLSPILALQRLSMGLSGSDLLAQHHFADSAEAHRRRIIKQLNYDMMIHGGEKGFEYMADRSLWESIPDFKVSQVSLKGVLKYYMLEIFSITLWLFGFGVLAVRSIRHSLHAGS